MKIAVIGGGASGITAAIFAKRENPLCKVVVFEKNDRILKKIHATGNGRCNLSNKNIGVDFFHSSDKDCLAEILNTLTCLDINNFFNSIGIIFCEENGRLYPYSKRASAVCDALRFEAEKQGVEIICNKAIKKIIKKDNGFIIDGIYFDSAIIASGGAAAPMYGTDGGAFIMLRELGHTVNRPMPALTSVRVFENTKSLKGIRCQCHVTLIRDNNELKKECGELQFTDYGLSGIVIMQLSRLCRNNDTFVIDFMPTYTQEEVYEMLHYRREIFKQRCCEDFFTGVLHKSLGVFVLGKCKIKPSDKIENLSNDALTKLSFVLKNMCFSVDSPMGWNNSQTTCGGASLKEFNSNTLESKIIPGIFCTGEALDSVGDCGGYNLYWAWLTGMIAGKAAAKK